MNQKGFIFITPIIFLIIGAVLGASITLGIVKYKDKISASISNIFKKNEIVVSNEPAQIEKNEAEELPTIQPEVLDVGTPTESVGAKPTSPPLAPTPEPEPARSSDVSGSAQPEGHVAETPAPVFEPTPGLDPDLIIQSVTYYPTTPAEGDIMSFYAAIKNQGEGSANVSIANLSIDGIDIKQITIPILVSNKTGTLIWKEVWKATKGDRKLKICLDADSKIFESSEENNCFELNFYVLKTQRSVDYIIKSTQMTPSSPVAGDTLSFSAEVYNQGNTFTASPSSTQLRIDLNNDGTWDISTKNAYTDPIDPSTGQKESWRNVWTIPQGTHKYEICADALSNINESNENNNCLSKIFAVP